MKLYELTFKNGDKLLAYYNNFCNEYYDEQGFTLDNNQIVWVEEV